LGDTSSPLPTVGEMRCRSCKADNQPTAKFCVECSREKVSALETARFFLNRKKRADFKAFDKIIKRRGGKPPRQGVEMPG
jgi:hypothetical protein